MKRFLGTRKGRTPLVAVLMCAAAAMWLPASTASASPTPPAGPGLSPLSACVADRHQLDLVVLMDESGSLASGSHPSDPGAVRVVALQQMLDGLSSSIADLPGRPAVDVALTGFSSGLDQVRGFAPLNAGSADSFKQAASLFADRNKGDSTDFGVALTGARDELARQAATHASPSCQAVVLFTDGRYDSGNRSGDAAARAALCQQGQIIDQLRHDDITLVAVGLGSDPASLLPQLVGSGGCGDVPAASGLFVGANDVSSLISAFDLAGALIGGATDLGTTTVLQRDFYLGADLRGLDLLTRPPAGTASVVLTAPNGQTAQLSSSHNSAALGGISFQLSAPAPDYWRVSGKVTDSSGAQVGAWSAAFVAQGQSTPEQASVDVVLFPALRAALARGAVAYVGQANLVHVDLVAISGAEPAAPQFAQPHQLTVTVGDPASPTNKTQLPAQPDGNGFAFSFPAPRTDAATSMDVSLVLSALTPDGQTSTTVTTSAQLPLHAQTSYPQLVTNRIDLGTVTGAESRAAHVAVTGGVTPGCLTVGSFRETVVPAGVTRLVATPDHKGCLPVAAGERLSIPVTFTHQGMGTGRLSGDLTLVLRNGSGQEISVRMPVSGQFLRPVNPGKRLGILLGLLIAGVLLPLALMYLIARIGGRLGPLSSLRYVTIPVTVTGTTVTAERPLVAKEWIADVRPVPDGMASASFINVPDGPSIRRKVSLNPFEAPRAVAEFADAHVVASDGLLWEASPADDAGALASGVLSTRLDASWAFVTNGRLRPDDVEPALRGRLTVLIADDAGNPDPLGDALASAARRLPEAAAPLLNRDAREDSSDDTSSPTRTQGLDPRFTADPFA